MKAKEMLKQIKANANVRGASADAFREVLDELDPIVIQEEEELEWERRDHRMQRKTARKAKQERKALAKPEVE